LEDSSIDGVYNNGNFFYIDILPLFNNDIGFSSGRKIREERSITHSFGFY
jgi:hypothetical protein